MQRFFLLHLTYLLIPFGLAANELELPLSFDRLSFHEGPKPLFKGATTNDWPRFNGPKDNAVSTESPLIKKWLPAGPTLLWEVAKGEGYASPGIKGERLVLFHRLNGKEMVECLDSESGKRYWNYEYPVEYRDRYGYSNGPRASPVIDGEQVYLHGVTAWLTCLSLKTGKLIWKRNLAEEFAVPEYFFGKGSNPIIAGEKLILNLGGAENRCVVAFDKMTGKQAWIAKDSWGASYSSPTMARIHGKEVCFVLTGGESRPPDGGLLVLDPDTGKKLARFPWRASKFESANAVPPVPVGRNRIFLSECYELGGVLVEFSEKFVPKVLWKKPDFNIHWMTPVLSDGHLYGVSGRHQQGAEMVCVEVDSGKEAWRSRIAWEQEIQGRKIRLEAFRASLLRADGHYLCLSEFGSLLWLDLSPKGWEIISATQLFFASGTWTLPALSRGLLYVMQNETDRMSNTRSRILCYDLRKN